MACCLSERYIGCSNLFCVLFNSGFPGPNGQQGFTGSSGIQGATGPRGNPGFGGPGAPGFTGSSGPIGATGSSGQPGSQGPPGAVGPAGFGSQGVLIGLLCPSSAVISSPSDPIFVHYFYLNTCFS